MLSRSGSRCAFTLVELLVVIAIIGVLVALLLPAVQAAREAANRMSCSNNLKQLGLAMQNYHDVYKKLPYASSYYQGPDTLPKHTWVEFILPFIEQQPLFDAIDFRLGNDNAVNKVHLENKPFPFVACPSNGRSDQFYADGLTAWHNSFPSQGLDYPLAAGTISPDGPTPDCASEGSFCISETSTTRSWGQAHLRKSPGLFNRGVTKHKFASITDGLSNTFLAGDRIAQGCQWGGSFTPNFPVAYAAQKPNSPTYDKAKPNEYRRNCGYSSFHPGGVNMVLGDGAVRFIPETVDFPTWCYLSDMADGKAVQVP